MEIKTIRTQTLTQTGQVGYGTFLIRTLKQKVKKDFSHLFNVTSCHHFGIVKTGTVSSESKPDAFLGHGATGVLWAGLPLQENITFSSRQNAYSFAPLLCTVGHRYVSFIGSGRCDEYSKQQGPKLSPQKIM